VHHYEKAKRDAQSEEDESLLFMAGPWVFQEEGLFIGEGRLRFYIGNAVLLLVGPRLP
jgi:hypothetical protein